MAKARLVLLQLPRKESTGARASAQLSQLCLCHKVSNVVHLLDPVRLQATEAREEALRRAQQELAAALGERTRELEERGG